MNINIVIDSNVDQKFSMMISQTDIKNAFFSISNRDKRNGSNYYQKRHISGFTQTTLKKKPLNWLVTEHLKNNLFIDPDNHMSKIIAISVGDTTSNLLRCAWTDGFENSFFHLEDEPFDNLREKNIPYHALVVKKDLSFSIEEVYFLKNSKKIFPTKVPTSIDSFHKHCKFMFCSIPLIKKSMKLPIADLCFWNYDLRQIFTNNDAYKDLINNLYKDWQKDLYYDKITELLNQHPVLPNQAIWYHSCIGLTKDKNILILHYTGSLIDLQNKLLEYNVYDALLLDSGGSCFVWGNWLPGYLSHHHYFRPERGSVLVLELNSLFKK